MVQQSNIILTLTWCSTQEVTNIIGKSTVISLLRIQRLFIIIVGLTVERAIRDGYEAYFDRIDSCLEEYLGEGYCPEDERTDVAIKFEIQLPRQTCSPIGVDLILSPYFSDQHDLLRSLKTVDKSKWFKL